MSEDERYRRVQSLFLQLCDTDREVQRTRLREIEDEALRLQVGSMLDRDGSFEEMQGDTRDAQTQRRATPLDRASGCSPSERPEIEGYEFIEAIGRGGMGFVWRAVQLNTQRDVAVKFIDASMHRDEKLVARFHREIELVARLSHPHIVRVFHSGEWMERPYYVMELVDGVELQEFHRTSKPSHQESLKLIASICDAVQHAHQQGVIHRDIKPSNILVRRDGSPYLVDFGIATTVADENTLTRMTQHGQVLGTPAYLSPEQANGSADRADTRSDLYSIGVVLFELLTSESPYEPSGSHLAIIRKIGEGELRAPRQVDPTMDRDLESVLLKSLRFEPDGRYATASDFADDLRRWIAGEPVLARRASPIDRAAKFVRRRPTVSLLIAFAVTLLMILSIGGPLTAYRQARLIEQIESEQRLRDQARLEMLLSADVGSIAVLLEEVRPEMDRIRPLIEEALARPSLSTSRRRNASLALAADNREAVDGLVEELPTAPLDAYLATRSVIAWDSKRLIPQFWRLALAPTEDIESRFRAAGFLASVDPMNPQWSGLDEMVSDQLVRRRPVLLDEWMAVFEPIRERLVEPLTLRLQSSTVTDEERVTISQILAVFARDRLADLIDWIEIAEQGSFGFLHESIAAHGDDAIEAIEARLDRLGREFKPDKHGHQTRPGNVAFDASSFRRCGNLLIALARLGRWERCIEALRQSPDPTIRSHVITHLHQFDVKGDRLASQLESQNDPAIERALILALGYYSLNDLAVSRGERLTERFLAARDETSDAGIQSAIRWTLSRWGVESPSSKRTAVSSDGWYVNSLGDVMVKLRPEEFYSGGPNHRDNRTLFQQKHLSRIEREFAISATEATVRQFEKFLSETDHYYESGRALGVSEDAPQTLVKWYSAAAFCNWLSEREGIPKSQWCFAPDQAGVFGVGARTQLDVLDRTGYRMPTELEWQYACMADTATNWSFGNDIEATSQFAWHAANSEGRFHAVARLLPNEFGLFDMHGNVREFCLNLVETNRGALVSSRLASDRTYVFPTTATLSASDPSRLASVALRGGTSLNSPEYLRTASWMPLSVNSAGMSTGFRVARTLKSNPRHQPGYGFTEGLRLEQAGQHVRTPHLDLHEHEAFTIEGWVRDWKGPLVSIGSSRSTPRITLAHVKATMQGPGIEPTALVFGDAIPFGLHHRAFVVDGNSRRFYVDGQLVAEATADGVPNIPDQRPMLIGQMEGQSIAFSIGEVFLIEVSSVARYDTSFEPKPRRNADEHTLRLYDFEAISGDHVPDLSAAKAHGKLIRP